MLLVNVLIIKLCDNCEELLNCSCVNSCSSARREREKKALNDLNLEGKSIIMIIDVFSFNARQSGCQSVLKCKRLSPLCT